MNFGQIYTQVARQFDSAAIADSKLWTNQAAHEFYDRRKFSWRESVATIATVSGQADYILAGGVTLVPDYDGFISFRHNSANASTVFNKLAEFYQDDFDELFSFAGATPGIPTCCTVRGSAPISGSGSVHAGGEQVLSLYCVPNYIGIGKLAYYRHAGSIEMVSDTDIPLAPVQYHRVIVDLAIAIGLRAEDQMIEASQHESKAEALIQSAIAADAQLRPSMRSKQVFPPHIPPTDPRQGPPYGFEQDR
jgi:hypothetical protein